MSFNAAECLRVFYFFTSFFSMRWRYDDRNILLYSKQNLSILSLYLSTKKTSIFLFNCAVFLGNAGIKQWLLYIKGVFHKLHLIFLSIPIIFSKHSIAKLFSFWLKYKATFLCVKNETPLPNSCFWHLC